MRHTPITPKSQYKAIWWISLCIGEDDEELVSELQTAKEVWQELKKKYADNQATGRKLLKQYFSFQKAEDMSIDGAWTHLQALGKRIKVAQPEMAAAINPKARAQVLLSGLPEQWSTIRDAIDGQPSLSPESILSILQEKECPPITCDDTRLRNNFEHYKNRPEFRDEAGGDGELYGRAGDMIRPGTPSSIATGLTRVGDWDSDYGHSREASGNSDYHHDRSGSQSRDTSRTRVPGAEAGYAMPAGYHQTPSNLRGESPMGRPSFGHPAMSRNQSREGLVQHPAQMGASTPAGDLGYGQVRYGQVPGDTPGYDANEEDTSYDYFRRGRNRDAL
ncbi:hypothetical protein CKM354_000094200 [Cercospora kikuchii]|uniref:Uncharacterized protein n=1 Tax=Cercospora kikuchii TaxID=84275 RepID=A0A9P3C6C0_9PEZI|nr:uncharacterized protein CKM354_000094200 [Cercospora kikuchii]GIZ37497.1 hypothetical protein CKM354_000094200 [Cercospora kikuchii]